jgi:excisionase family DNA binding protein
MIEANGSAFISPAEAARRLGVSPRRIYALVADQRIRARRVGGRLLIERDDVDARAEVPSASGRPFSPRRSWALLLLAAGSNPSGVDAATKSKLKRVLRERDLWSMRARLGRRSQCRPLRAHSSDLARIGAEPGVVRTGARYAADAGLGLVAPDAPVEIYLTEAMAEHVVERYRLAPSPRPNVVLRVVPNEIFLWLHGPVAPRFAIALDLAEDRDPRSRDVARSILERT